MIAVYLAMLETDVDRDKFMKLYESYEKKLFAIALRILENNEKAEDAVQQAWLRIIQHWERVRTAVLMWEDLETNTIFRLRGVLSKEDILYMAESMTRSEKSNKT